MRIGIFGGSFNPIHNGHLITAAHVYDAFELDIVHLVIANTPPHKDANALLAGEKRLEMARLAVSGDDRFHVSDTEFRKNQSPYTVDLLATYRNDFPGDELFLIIGADSLHNIRTWHRWQELPKLADRIIVLGRPEFELDILDAEISEMAVESGCPLVDISSTMIRNMIEAGRNIRYFVPDRVREYIETNRLYRSI